MSDLSFVYEFNFSNGLFEQNIYDNCNIVDTIGDRQTYVENKVSEMLNIFQNVPGLNIFSTFLTHNDTKYKITLNNIQ